MRARNGKFLTVQVQNGSGTFVPGDTNVSGTFCYQFGAEVTSVRAEMRLHPGDSCAVTNRSAQIAPCPVDPPCALTFSDVDRSNPFYTEISSLATRGVISGYPDGTFRPQVETTRGQMAKIVAKAFEVPASTTEGPHFSDVPEGSTFYESIETLHGANILGGYPDGTFRPGQKVTRGQVAKLVVLAARLQLVSPQAATFSDVPLDSPFYTYIETAYSNGVLQGYSDGSFKPEAYATRGQIAKIVALAPAPADGQVVQDAEVAKLAYPTQVRPD